VLTGFDRAGQRPQAHSHPEGFCFSSEEVQLQVRGSGSGHSATKSLAVFLAEACGRAGREAPVRARHPQARGRSLIVNRFSVSSGVMERSPGSASADCGPEDEVEVAGELGGDRLDAARLQRSSKLPW